MPQAQKDLDLLLIMCPPWDTAQPPLNLGYLSAYANANGLQAQPFDLNIKLSNMTRNMGMKELWQLMSQLTISSEAMTEQLFEAVPQIIGGFISRILASGASTLGFSVHMRNLAFTERLVAQIREQAPDRTIIYGGPEVTIRHNLGQLGAMSADAYVIGEGEQTLVELVKGLRRAGELELINGVVLREGEDGLSAYTPRLPIKPLDDLPFPDWSDFDISWYRPDDTVDLQLPLLSSRGCTGQCTFCVDHSISGRYRTRSGQNLFEEVKRNVERYGVTTFEFNDLICNGHLGQLEAFADLVIADGMRINWWSYAVIRPKMEPALFAKLRRSGCDSLTFGLESGSDAVLKAMKKYYTAEDAEVTLKRCAKAGINTGINLIVGYPGEGCDEFEETLEFVRRNRKWIHRVVNLGSCLRSPGSELHRDPEAFGIKLDEERGTWFCDDGNTIEERNGRLTQAQHLLEQLNIPRVILNREIGFEQFVSEGDRDERGLAMDYGIKIIDIIFLDAAEEETRSFEPGGLMNLIIRFQVTKPIENIVARVQFFNDENPQRENLFIFGMNTDRSGTKVGPLQEGWVDLRLVIYQLALAPGKFLTTLGLFPDVDSLTGYDVKHGQYEFLIEGERDPAGARLQMSSSWSHELCEEGWRQGEDWIERVTVSDGQGLELPSFKTAEPVLLTLDCNISEAKKQLLVAELKHKGVLLLRAVHPTPLPQGRGQVQLRFDPMFLLEGTYQLEASLVDKKSGEVKSSSATSMRVSSLLNQGGGLLYLPCAWEMTTHSY